MKLEGERDRISVYMNEKDSILLRDVELIRE